MLSVKLYTINLIAIIIITIVIIICSIGIIISISFQKKQKKKYDECLKLVKEKQNSTLLIENELNFQGMDNLYNKLDINRLMSDLYNIYLIFLNKLNSLNADFEDILIGPIKEVYKNKVDVLRLKNYKEVTDSIDLINYSIIDYSNKKLQFRITVNCFSYTISNNIIVSGSNLLKVEQVIILTFEKEDEKWLISNYEKVYQKFLNS